MSLAWVLDIDEDVIKVNNDENIEFFGHNLVNIALQAGLCVERLKRYYLVLEEAVSSLKGRFLLIVLFYPHLMINTREIKLGKLFCLT